MWNLVLWGALIVYIALTQPITIAWLALLVAVVSIYGSGIEKQLKVTNYLLSVGLFEDEECEGDCETCICGKKDGDTEEV